MQVRHLMHIMTAARSGCSSLLQQCYQQLYTLLGDTELNLCGVAKLTPRHASTIAATLKGKCQALNPKHNKAVYTVLTYCISPAVRALLCTCAVC